MARAKPETVPGPLPPPPTVAPEEQTPTCQKLGIGFWDYLLDRITLDNRIPPLPELVAGTASLPP